MNLESISHYQIMLLKIVGSYEDLLVETFKEHSSEF